MPRLLFASLAILSIAAFLALEHFVTNPFTPAGHVGYLVEQPRFFGRGGYHGMQKGPTVHGATLARLTTVNVDTRPKAFQEVVEILDSDRRYRVSLDAVVRVSAEAVPRFVEEFGAASDWYESWVRPDLRDHVAAIVRENAGGRELRISPEMLGDECASRMRKSFAGSGAPFLVESIQVSGLDLPAGFRVRTLPTPSLTGSPSESEDQGGGESEPAKPGPGPGPVEETSVPAAPRNGLVEMSHRRELRGAWLTTASNVDWPSNSGLSVEAQKGELIEYLDTMTELRMNALFLQVRSGADAIYPSSLEPWSAAISGEQGKAPSPFYDPLAFAIDECRKRSIELHAWINPYRAKPLDRSVELAPGHVANTMSRHVHEYGDVLWMDPGAKPVQDWILGVISDLVCRYDVDGVHFDDYFYPYPKRNLKFPDQETYDDYLACCGTLDLDEWRRMNVDSLIRRVSEEVHAIKPWIKFGVSPFGIYRVGEPEGVEGLDQYTEIYADPKKWLEKGWVDYLAPQLYWKSTSKNQPYEKLLKWWSEQNALRRHVYAGVSLMSIEPRHGGWPVSEFEKQFAASRGASDRQSLGNIVFGMKVFKGRRAAQAKAMFVDKIYPEKALPPAMPWMNGELPAAPRNVRVESEEIRWDPARSEWLRHWAVYSRSEDNAWKLADVLSSDTNHYAAAPGVYAVCAVDRAGQESAGAIAEIIPPPPPEPRSFSETEWLELEDVVVRKAD